MTSKQHEDQGKAFNDAVKAVAALTGILAGFPYTYDDNVKAKAAAMLPAACAQFSDALIAELDKERP